MFPNCSGFTVSVAVGLVGVCSFLKSCAFPLESKVYPPKANAPANAKAVAAPAIAFCFLVNCGT